MLICLLKIVTTFCSLVQPNFERFTFYDTLISSSLDPNQTFNFHKHLHNFICYCSSQKKSEGTDIVIDQDWIRHEVFPCPRLHSSHYTIFIVHTMIVKLILQEAYKNIQTILLQPYLLFKYFVYLRHTSPLHTASFI